MSTKNKEDYKNKEGVRWIRFGVVALVSASVVIGIYFLGVWWRGRGGVFGLAGSTPSDIQWRRDEIGNVMVTWKAKAPTIGMVIYGYDSKRLFKPVMSANEAVAQKEHVLVVTESPMVPVYFMIFSGGKLYGDKGDVFVAQRSDINERSVTDQKGQP